MRLLHYIWEKWIKGRKPKLLEEDSSLRDHGFCISGIGIAFCGEDITQAHQSYYSFYGETIGQLHLRQVVSSLTQFISDVQRQTPPGNLPFLTIRTSSVITSTTSSNGAPSAKASSASTVKNSSSSGGHKFSPKVTAGVAVAVAILVLLIALLLLCMYRKRKPKLSPES